MSRNQDSRPAAINEVVSHAEFIAKSCEGDRLIPGVLPGADAVLNPRMRPVSSVDETRLGSPAAQLSKHVRCPQGVTPAVPGLEQAQLGARVPPRVAGEDPHAGRFNGHGLHRLRGTIHYPKAA